MEKDDELKGKGNSYDFGARMYDPRLGRFLSLDPQVKKLPSNSPYSFAVNSPILFVDFGGEHPKVAIILGTVKEGAFDTHKAALEKAGYKVIYAKTGEEALKIMGDLSPPDSPIENLILISHGSPGGLSNQARGGIYTDSELKSLAKADWQQNRKEELAKEKGVVTNSDDPNYDVGADTDIWEQANEEAEALWNGVTQENIETQNAYIVSFKQKTGAITPSDISNALNNGEVNFTQQTTIVLGGCNTGGYHQLDEQEIFSTTLATETKTTVFSSQGYTGPNFGTTQRVSNSNSSSRNLKGQWIRTDPQGNRKGTGKSTIDMAKPQ